MWNLAVSCQSRENSSNPAHWQPPAQLEILASNNAETIWAGRARPMASSKHGNTVLYGHRLSYIYVRERSLLMRAGHAEEELHLYSSAAVGCYHGTRQGFKHAPSTNVVDVTRNVTVMTLIFFVYLYSYLLHTPISSTRIMSDHSVTCSATLMLYNSKKPGCA
jgi:hypothetical protein